MAHADDRSLLDSLGDRPVVRVVAYYVLLSAVTMVLERTFPRFAQILTEQSWGSGATAGGFTEVATTGLGTTKVAPDSIAVVLASTVLLMLPVAWLYTLARSKRGYQQAFVQTILMLPFVVAGVAMLVKNSLALAFSLGGIVGAVAFRNRLDDTKDAVYVFLAIAVGLACGVQAVRVAAVLSAAFNLLVLVLWWTDFGRMPAALQGPVLERRLERARSAGRGDPRYLSLLDRELLRSMTPEQLAELQSRAGSRRNELADRLEVPGAPDQRDRVLRVELTEWTPEQRALLEAVLAAEMKSWTLAGEGASGDGRRWAEYRVRLRRRATPEAVEGRLRAVLGGHFAACTFA